MDVNKIIKLNDNDALKLLMSLDKKDRKFLLKNEIFRKHLLNDFLLFTSIINSLDNDLDYLCDDDFAGLIVTSDPICISNLMMCSNSNINSFLSKNIVINYLYNNIDEIKYYLSSKTLNLDFTKRFFNVLLSDDKTTIKYLIYFSEDIQDVVLNQNRFSNLKEKLEYNLNNIDEVLELLPNYSKLYQQTYDEVFLTEAQKLSKKYLISMISEYFFKLNFVELKRKIKTILDYAFFEGNVFSDSNYKIGIYSLLANMEKLDILEIKRLCKLLDDLDLEKDYLQTREHCFGELNNSLFKGKNFYKSRDKYLSTVYGRDVCVLDGEDFFMLIHSTKVNREKGDLPDMSSKTTYLFSLISNEHLLTYQDPLENIVLGYDTFDTNNVTSMYETNAFTDFGNKRVPRLYAPKQLIEKTIGFNTIVYLDNEYSLKPSYIVCYDKVKIGDLEASESLGGIPLVIIDTKAYKKEIDRKK